MPPTCCRRIPAVSYSALAGLCRKQLLQWSTSSLLVSMDPTPEFDPHSPNYQGDQQDQAGNAETSQGAQ